MSPRIHYESVATTTEVTPTTTTATTTTTLEETTTLRTTTLESTTIISNTNPIDQTTEVIEHTNNLISNETETSSVVPMTNESHLLNEDYSSSTFISLPSSESDAAETTSSTTSTNDYITTSEATEKGQMDQTTVASTQPRLIQLLTNLSYAISSDNVTSTDENVPETSTGRSNRISSLRNELFFSRFGGKLESLYAGESPSQSGLPRILSR